MIDLSDPEVQFAIQAVRQAALLVQHVQAELVTPALTKQDRSPVTVADFTAQAAVGRLLAKTFPEDALVAEEDSQTLRTKDGSNALALITQFVSRIQPGVDAGRVCAWIDYNRVDSAPRFWTLDPIDGTKGFLRGDQYATALALVVDGQVQIGVLGCPNLEDGYRPDLGGVGSLVLAARGQGTWVTSLAGPEGYERLRVSTRNQPEEARILRSFEAGHTNADQIGEFARALGVQTAPVRMDSQAKYAVLAAGKGDILLRLISPEQPDYKEKIWDQAAGSLVLEEAGGSITDLMGRRLDFTTGRSLQNNRGVLASNGHYHPLALQALSAIGI
jgi:3'-phosphoadenosine 5'-phosphosulfate (PAPS) 3'-phosphatase